MDVVEADSGSRTFQLTLVNGKPIEVPVVPLIEAMEPLDGDDLDAVSAATLDASGTNTTLHILEGIAADGKQWIPHEERREEARLKQWLQGEKSANERV